MKYRIALALLAVMSMPLVGLAADEKPAVTDEQLGKMQQALKLSDEQVAKMRQIRDEGGTKKEMRAVLTDEQKAQAKAKSKASLTDEQLKKMQVQLKLSEEQVAKMRQIREDGGTRSDLLAVLTDEQKGQLKEMKQINKEKTGKGEKKAKPDASGAASA